MAGKFDIRFPVTFNNFWYQDPTFRIQVSAPVCIYRFQTPGSKFQTRSWIWVWIQVSGLDPGFGTGSWMQFSVPEIGSRFSYRDPNPGITYPECSLSGWQPQLITFNNFKYSNPSFRFDFVSDFGNDTGVFDTGSVFRTKIFSSKFRISGYVESNPSFES